MRNAKNKPVITAENILKVLSAIVTIIFFCPIFSISFSGQKAGISVMKMVGGIKYNGDPFIKSQLVLLLSLLLPATILVVLFIRQITEEMVSLISATCGAVDLIVLFVSRVIAKKMSNNFGFSFKSTAWFVFDVIFLLSIITLSVLVIVRVVYLQEDLIVLIRETAERNPSNQMASAVKRVVENISEHVGKSKTPKEDIMGYCFKCGTPLIFEDEFCTSCGWPVPKALIEEAEEERRAAEEARRAEEEARRAAEEAARKEAEERARREAEERARREAEERARREAEERARREEEEARRAAEEARRAEEEAWLEEEDRRRREAARRRERPERPERRRPAPPKRVRDDADYFDNDFIDERTDRAISELAYEPDSKPRPRNGSRSRNEARSQMAARSRAIYCLRCGEKLPGDAVFCTYCGARIAKKMSADQ